LRFTSAAAVDNKIDSKTLEELKFTDGIIVKAILKAEEEKSNKELMVGNKLSSKAKEVFKEIYKEFSTDDGKMKHEHLIKFYTIHYGKL